MVALVIAHECCACVAAATSLDADTRETLAELIATITAVGRRIDQLAGQLDALDVNDARRAGADQARIAENLRELSQLMVRPK